MGLPGIVAGVTAVTQFNKQRRGRKRETRDRRQLERENAAIRANVERNTSPQFGGAVPGTRAPASEGGPPRIIQGAGSSLLTGGVEPFFPNQRRRT